MTFTINQAALLSALNIAGKAVGTNNVIPALSNYLFDFTKDTLSVTGSNMEVFITTTIEVKSKFTGSLMVPAQRIAGLVKELPAGDLKCELEKKVNEVNQATFYNLTIKSGRGVYVIPCDLGEDFPVMICNPDVSFEIPSDTLQKGISKTLFAASKDEAKASLVGVLLSFENSKLTFTACDHHVLSTVSVDIEAETSKQFIVPSKPLSLIQGLPCGEVVTIAISERNISFTINDTTVVKCGLVDEKYPDYQQVIPVNNSGQIKIERSQLISCLKRVGQFTNFAINAVNFKIDSGSVAIHSANDFNETALEDLDCELVGEGIDIWLKGDQVLSVLNRMEGSHTFINYSKPNRAVIFKTDNSPVDSKIDLMLTMPVMP